MSRKRGLHEGLKEDPSERTKQENRLFTFYPLFQEPNVKIIAKAYNIISRRSLQYKPIYLPVRIIHEIRLYCERRGV